MITIYDGRSEFYQWDLNRKIIVSDPTVTKVHFCNKTGPCSLVVEVKEVGDLRLADVPNILLQTSWPIRAYAYCGDCYTKESVTFKVNARSKPDDYVYTETDVFSIEEIVDAALREAIENGDIDTELEEGSVTMDILADDVKEELTDIQKEAEQAQETAKTAERIAKGANRAEVFQTEAGMLEWLPSNVYEGLELPAGSTIIISADAVGNSVYASLNINGIDIFSYSVDVYTKYNRDYAYYVLPEAITVETFYYSFDSFDGDIGGNWRCAWTKQTLDNNSITNALLAPNNIPVGTNLYIRDTGVPDYWWDGEKPCELETQKVNLTPIEEGLQSILDAIDSIL